jgi:hypothetical protein
MAGWPAPVSRGATIADVQKSNAADPIHFLVAIAAPAARPVGELSQQEAHRKKHHSENEMTHLFHTKSARCPLWPTLSSPMLAER